MFLTPQEIQIMNHDFETIVKGPESVPITVKYRTWMNPSVDPTIDPVYKTDSREIDPLPVEVPTKALQHILGLRDLQKLPDRIIEVGNAVFYFSKSFNLQEPSYGKPVVPHSLIFVDPNGVEWVPLLEDPGELARSVILQVDSVAISQPVAARIRK